MKLKNVIKDLPLSELLSLIQTSNSYADVIDKLHLNKCGAQYDALRKRVRENNISITHFNKSLWTVKAHASRTTPLDQILVVNSTYKRNSGSIKKRLISAGIMQDKCAICGQEPLWNNQPLVLILDHINGIRNDNRIENLRILCPNCHSQSPTFSGRNKRKL